MPSAARSGSPLPAYEQVKAFIKARIHQGEWRPGDPVPSESALQQQFGMSRMTVHRALRELAQDGLVTRTQGAGTVVAQLHRISSTLAFRDIHEEIIERGHLHTTRVERVEVVRSTREQARIFALRSGARLFHSVMVHCENDVPIQLEDRLVNPASAPGYLNVNFNQTTPTHYLLEHAPLTEASYVIDASLATATEAKALQIRRGDACLTLTRRTVSGRHVASYARLVYPAARYRFSGRFAL